MSDDNNVDGQQLGDDAKHLAREWTDSPSKKKELRDAIVDVAHRHAERLTAALAAARAEREIERQRGDRLDRAAGDLAAERARADEWEATAKKSAHELTNLMLDEKKRADAAEAEKAGMVEAATRLLAEKDKINEAARRGTYLSTDALTRADEDLRAALSSSPSAWLAMKEAAVAFLDTSSHIFKGTGSGACSGCELCDLRDAVAAVEKGT
jgi:hypothetical protein